MSEYAVAHLDEIDELTDGREPWRPVRHHFGITSFGVTAWTGRDVGDRIINEHDEKDDNEELYFVHRGRARFEFDGEQVDAPEGTFVFAKPGARRTAFAEEPETTILALGGTPGEAYVPDGWELWAPVGPLYQAGKYAEAADMARDIVEAHPDYPALVYNLACCESLAGRREDAVRHLRSAIERSAQLRRLAVEDDDVAAIRDDPAIKELLG